MIRIHESRRKPDVGVDEGKRSSRAVRDMQMRLKKITHVIPPSKTQKRPAPLKMEKGKARAQSPLLDNPPFQCPGYISSSQDIEHREWFKVPVRYLVVTIIHLIFNQISTYVCLRVPVIDYLLYAQLHLQISNPGQKARRAQITMCYRRASIPRIVRMVDYDVLRGN